MSISDVLKKAGVCGAATIFASVFALGLVGATPAGANTLTSADGNTQLQTTGSVSPGTPYSSGQSINVEVQANSTMNNANLVANSTPGQTTGDPTGDFYVEECVAPNGVLPTAGTSCEKATQDFSVSKTTNGSLNDQGYQVYILPDPALGSTTLQGSCGLAPNYCVIGIFATDPNAGNGFNYPHLFSALFQTRPSPDGLDDGASPGDGTPEVPLAIGLPLLGLAVFGGLTIRSRRRNRQQQVG
jgi:hypothetical protein